ncbi:hypothetical protein SAMN02910289_00745 [Lachnospiraceae bacterium RM5]|nr:hypothetical protein SAMN02910289_00745 [Lachnospiraceae bacterium RM5]
MKNVIFEKRVLRKVNKVIEIVYRDEDWIREDKEQIINLFTLVKFKPRVKGKRLEEEYDTNFSLLMGSLEHGLTDITSECNGRLDKYWEKLSELYDHEMNMMDSYCYNLYIHDRTWLKGKVNENANDNLLNLIENNFVYECKDKNFSKKILKRNCIRLAIEFGKFKLALERIKQYSKIKELPILNEETMYDFYETYYILVSYLLGDERVSKEDIDNLVKTIRFEHHKGNISVYRSMGSRMGINELYYIYYRYVLGIPNEELTGENVFLTMKKGLLHWREN